MVFYMLFFLAVVIASNVYIKKAKFYHIFIINNSKLFSIIKIYPQQPTYFMMTTLLQALVNHSFLSTNRLGGWCFFMCARHGR